MRAPANFSCSPAPSHCTGPVPLVRLLPWARGQGQGRRGAGGDGSLFPEGQPHHRTLTWPGCLAWAQAGTRSTGNHGDWLTRPGQNHACCPARSALLCSALCTLPAGARCPPPTVPGAGGDRRRCAFLGVQPDAACATVWVPHQQQPASSQQPAEHRLQKKS